MRSSERHQLKADQFAAATGETIEWASEHRKALTYGTGILVAVAAILIAGFYWQQSRQQKASALFAEALQHYTAPVVPAATPVPAGAIGYHSASDRAADASRRFVEVANKYPHTDSGTMANYFVGLTAADMGDNTKAEEYLKKVADGGSSDIAALAKSALANLYHDTGRDQQAIDLYKQLIDKPTNTVPKAQSQLALADLYATKDPSQARTIYIEVAKDHAENSIGQIANQHMASLK